MNQPETVPMATVTMAEIVSATGLSERSVTRWLRRLGTKPCAMQGRFVVYPSQTVADIQAGQIQAHAKRNEAIRRAVAQPRIITVKEAKRRAKGGRR